MAPTEPAATQLTPCDLDERRLDEALALSAEAGWNQVADDWRLMLRSGTGFGVLAPGGRLVASAICMPYGPTFGWISMVLVSRHWRKRGIATALLQRCIAHFDAAKSIPLLDATPAGQRVYEPLGFTPHFELTRWHRPDRGDVGEPSQNTRPLEQTDMPALMALDAAMLGGPRTAVLNSLAMRGTNVGRVTPDGKAFVLWRAGRTATQIGPLVAHRPEQAIALLSDAAATVSGDLLVDAADDKTGIADWLKDNGFTVQRRFARMARGRQQPFGDPSLLFAAAGPELG